MRAFPRICPACKYKGAAEVRRHSLGRNDISMSEENAEVVSPEVDEVEAARAAMSAQDLADQAEAAAAERRELANVTLAEADVHMFGDRAVLAQVAQLLSYIRHAVKNNARAEIKVVVNGSDSTVANAEFMFDVNGCQVPDCVAQPEWWVN